MRVAQVPPFEIKETMFCAGPAAASPRGSGAPFGAVGPSGGAVLPCPALLLHGECGEPGGCAGEDGTRVVLSSCGVGPAEG